MSEIKIKSFFECGAVRTVKLTDWMKWASDQDSLWHIVLPMIQRGSVWTPHKILDLWDTLLRGMPIGAVMATEAKEETYIALANRESLDKPADAISLIDGQQRTLAMLASWPNSTTNILHPVSIWVDFADEAQGEYRFRLWAATGTQPFGFERASMGSQALNKLARYKRRLANIIYGKESSKNTLDLWKCDDFMPWEAKFALNLAGLIENKNDLAKFVEQQRQLKVEKFSELQKSTIRNLASLGLDEGQTKKIEDAIEKHFGGKLDVLEKLTTKHLQVRAAEIKVALDHLDLYEFPVIQVAQKHFEEVHRNDDYSDPALAVLFKRVGTGGEPLSNADYIYSVIKHNAPQAHNLVEEMLDDKNDKRIRAIYKPTSLVMSAVRLSIFSKTLSDKADERTLPDRASMDKAEFARLVRKYPDFVDEFNHQIKKDGPFRTSLGKVLQAISYSDSFKIGLPLHALCLIDIPLLETILAWYYKAKPSSLDESRLPIVRFLLYANLCVRDKPKASMICIKQLKEVVGLGISKVFPDRELIQSLLDEKNRVAYALPSPVKLESIFKPTLRDNFDGLRGWTRFHFPDALEQDRNDAEVYKLWWNRRGGHGHVHPMLLWLQREYVFNEFEQTPALAGMDDETPFDYDHILPSALWGDWTGTNKHAGTRFIDFRLKDKDGKVLDNTGDWMVGNAIGNIHLLESGDNRSWGDTPPDKKLYGKTDESIRKSALIDDAQEDSWINASCVKDKDARFWNQDRTLAFQRAVEMRTFSLYKKFYADLEMSEVWDVLKAPDT